MAIDVEAWEVENEAWRQERLNAWESEGMPLVVSMYQRGGDLDAEKAEAIKHYFLTGQLNEDAPFPLFYKLRFYPGNDESWLTECFRGADDFSIARFFKMYGVDSLGDHDRRMAKIIYDPQTTSRLAELKDSSGKSIGAEVIARRDFDLLKAKALHILRSVRTHQETPKHYWFHVESWLAIAQDFSSRSHRNDHEFVENLQAILEAVAEKLSQPDDRASEEFEFALGIKTLLDEELGHEHSLRSSWQEKKAALGIS